MLPWLRIIVDGRLTPAPASQFEAGETYTFSTVVFGTPENIVRYSVAAITLLRSAKNHQLPFPAVLYIMYEPDGVEPHWFDIRRIITALAEAGWKVLRLPVTRFPDRYLNKFEPILSGRSAVESDHVIMVDADSIITDSRFWECVWTRSPCGIYSNIPVIADSTICGRVPPVEVIDDAHDNFGTRGWVMILPTCTDYADVLRHSIESLARTQFTARLSYDECAFMQAGPPHHLSSRFCSPAWQQDGTFAVTWTDSKPWIDTWPDCMKWRTDAYHACDCAGTYDMACLYGLFLSLTAEESRANHLAYKALRAQEEHRLGGAGTRL